MKYIFRRFYINIILTNFLIPLGVENLNRGPIWKKKFFNIVLANSKMSRGLKEFCSGKRFQKLRWVQKYIDLILVIL